MIQKKIDAYGIVIGKFEKGLRNKITDVPGVKVGHSTVKTGDNQTGVTVILPCEDNPYSSKIVAAQHVINGFGKTTGLMQIEELGVIEGPIFMTNTLNVGLVYDAAVTHMQDLCKKDDIELKSYNPIVCECNDAYLNNIGHRVVTESHVMEAVNCASSDFLEGSIGAGRGMSCHHLKGGIGSASRIMRISEMDYTVGVLVLSNHGILEDFFINGKMLGHEIKQKLDVKHEEEKGSVIIVVATDLPVSDRQLKRVLKRVPVGLAKTGSYIGHGSGEVAIGFTTANRIKEQQNQVLQMNEKDLDIVFHALAEAVEESVLNSMITSETVRGYEGRIRYSLKEFIE